MNAGTIIAVMIVAGACHAGWNLVAKRITGDRVLVLMAAGATVLALLTPWALTHLPTEAPGAALGWAALRGLLNVIYLVGLSRAYSHFDLSLAYPMVRGCGPLVAVLLAVLLLHERPAGIAVAGVAVTSVAIVGLGLSGRRAARLVAPGRGGASGWLWVALTGATIGAYTVVDKVGVGYWNPVSYFWAVELCGFVLLGSYVAARGRSRELAAVFRRYPRQIFACAVLAAASYSLALFALQHALASYIAPLREVSVLFGALLGMLVLKEDHGLRRIGAAAGIFTGLVLVGLAL
jgi:drug/metabolite transporter (DMT)-like permease